MRNVFFFLADSVYSISCKCRENLKLSAWYFSGIHFCQPNALTETQSESQSWILKNSNFRLKSSWKWSGARKGKCFHCDFFCTQRRSVNHKVEICILIGVLELSRFLPFFRMFTLARFFLLLLNSFNCAFHGLLHLLFFSCIFALLNIFFAHLQHFYYYVMKFCFFSIHPSVKCICIFFLALLKFWIKFLHFLKLFTLLGKILISEFIGAYHALFHLHFVLLHFCSFKLIFLHFIKILTLVRKIWIF